MEEEFKIIGNNNDCKLELNRDNQLFTYTIEILSKTPVTISSNYWLRYIS